MQTNEEVLRQQAPHTTHSPILSYVQTNRDGAMNLDFVDQQRLLRELSPEEKATLELEQRQARKAMVARQMKPTHYVGH